MARAHACGYDVILAGQASARYSRAILTDLGRLLPSKDSGLTQVSAFVQKVDESRLVPGPDPQDEASASLGPKISKLQLVTRLQRSRVSSLHWHLWYDVVRHRKKARLTEF